MFSEVMVYTPTKPRYPGTHLKEKAAPADFLITGFDLHPQDDPSHSGNQSIRTVLFSPGFNEKGASQLDRFRTNVAVILRAFDFFFDLRAIDDFWIRLKRIVCQYYSPAAMEHVVDSYIAARHRYLEDHSTSSRRGQGMELVIAHLADKIISKQKRGLLLRSHLEATFSERKEQWADAAKDLDGLFGRPRNPPNKSHSASHPSVRPPDTLSSPKMEPPKERMLPPRPATSYVNKSIADDKIEPKQTGSGRSPATRLSTDNKPPIEHISVTGVDFPKKTNPFAGITSSMDTKHSTDSRSPPQSSSWLSSWQSVGSMISSLGHRQPTENVPAIGVTITAKSASKNMHPVETKEPRPLSQPILFGQPSAISTSASSMGQGKSRSPEAVQAPAADIPPKGSLSPLRAKRLAVEDVPSPNSKRRAVVPASAILSTETRGTGDELLSTESRTESQAVQAPPHATTEADRKQSITGDAPKRSLQHPGGVASSAVSHPLTTGPKSGEEVVSNINRSMNLTTSPIASAPLTDRGFMSSPENAELLRLQTEMVAKNRQMEELRILLKLSNDTIGSLRKREIEMKENVTLLENNKAELTNRLQAAEEKLTQTPVGPPSPGPPLSTTTTTEFVTATELEAQIRLKKCITLRDYKGLLGDVAAELQKLARPLVSSLKQETGDERSTDWKALENVWIALDWAGQQAKSSADSL
ncbi:hypothetical protein MN608_06892 [Microdochium nivale]|nr:hypothetical protein MN608_06892 [Microdochium nivale]